MPRIRASIPVVLGLIASGIFGIAAPAAAFSPTQPNIVNAVPAAATPDVDNGAVYGIGQVGNEMILGGSFTSVSPHATPGTVYTHNYVFGFNATTGAVDNTNFLPTVNGEVDQVIPGPAANEVYIGGSFSTVDGKTMHIALLNTTTGALVSTWKPAALNGVVEGVDLANGHLFVSGLFTMAGGVSHAGLVALDPNTGALTNYVSLAFTGHHNFGVQCTGTGCASAGTGVRRIDVDPSGTHLIAVGNFTSAGPTGGTASSRDQVALIDLGTTSATVDPSWATAAYTAQCFSGAFDSYVRSVQFSPDGSYFVIVATGGSGTNSDGTNSSCDTAARYETSGTGADVRPTWIDYTGQDTLASVAITGAAVYVGGHQRWLNNSLGHDNPGPGAVPRPGLAALNPITGLPLSWDPGRSPRGEGAEALLATSTGLWVGSDTDYIGNRQYFHGEIAFFPLAGGQTEPSDATPTLPGRVYTAGALASSSNSPVLYRIDAGGPTIAATDGGPDWQGDTTDPSPYRNTGSNTAGYGPVANVNNTVPASTPSAIFNSERWDPGNDVGDGGNLHWAFPVPAGDVVDVRLYFANRYTGTSGVGQRVFNVALDNAPFLTNFDIVQAAGGDQTGMMTDKVVTSDGEIDLDFSHDVENPLIDGIEIVKQSGPTSFTTPVPIYRLNAGGGQIAATDGAAANWLGDNSDTVGIGGPFRTGGNLAGWNQPWTDPAPSGGGGTVLPSVPSYVPSDIFASERWAPQTYTFPVAPGTPLNVNLFMANNCGCTSGAGQRIFNVAIDGTPVLPNYDIVSDVGNLTGEMKSFPIVAPSTGLVTVALTNGAMDNAVIDGIELAQTGATPTPPVVNVDRFSYRQFNGTTAGAEQNLNTGISWGSIRGAFTVNGELVYGKADGNLYERTFNGSTFGSEVLLDPWNDPTWDNVQTGSGQTFQGTAPNVSSEIPSITSMFFTNGRLYYTVAGDSAMHWRWFEPDDGIVGSDEFTVSDGNNWSDVAGAFLAGNTLYFADKATGELSSIGWSGTQATGAATVVDSSQDWASRGMFMLANATNPNQPPVAAFTPTCSTSSTSCTFDASASSDPDGSITDYAWTFGSSPTEHHPDATVISHDFTTAGKYSVTLTVTDNDGATTSKTEQVTVGESTPVPTFIAATTACGPGTGACGTSAVTNVGVPAGTAGGDALLMFVSWPTNPGTTVSVPAGWHQLGTEVSSPLESDVYYRAATGTDAGTTVPVTFSAKTHNSVTLADYTGADPNTIEAFAKSADSNTATHIAPAATVSTDGSLAVSYWSDKSSTTKGWTAPAAVTSRAQFLDTGGGYVTSLLADSNHTVASGTYPSQTATVTPITSPSGKGAEWSIILAPSGTTTAPPVAAFTPNCTLLSCSFDGSASTDPGGSITSYAWTFGDGQTGSGSSANNTYGSGGTYPVTLTVTGTGGLTNSITKSVTVSGPVSNIAFVGAAKYDNTGSTASATVPPAGGSGDTLVLFESWASTTVTATTPAGWTSVGTKTASNLTSAVYEKTATVSDPGSVVSVTFSASVKASLVIADYKNASASPIEVSASATSAGTSHTAPAVSGLTNGSWVLSYWTDKSTTTASWTTPAGETQRQVVFGSGSGAVSAQLADSGSGVSGSYPAQTAISGASSGSGVQWTVALTAGP